MGNSTSNNYEKMENVGFKVIEVIPGSPGDQCGLVSNTDFIISVDGKHLHDMLKGDILDLVERSEGKNVNLEVFDQPSNTTRQLVICPNRNWSGEGLLGIVIRLELYESIQEKTTEVPEFDLGFDAIYVDEHEQDRAEASSTPKSKSKLPTATKLMKRLSFHNNVTDSVDSPTNGNSNNAMRVQDDTLAEEPSPEGKLSDRRPSTSKRILRALSITSKSAASIDSNSSPSTQSVLTEDCSDTGESVASGEDKKKRSSSIFRKMSFTSKA